MRIAKKQVLDMVKKLPEKTTWDDAMYLNYVRKKIEAGIKAGDERRVISQEQVKRFYALTDEVRRAMKERGVTEQTVLADFQDVRKFRPRRRYRL